MQVPKAFNDYTDFEEIGSGAFSVVFSAIHIPTNKKVSIKEIPKVLLAEEKEFLNFKREIEIMRKVNHPFIIHFYQLIETDQSFFIVMEYCSNGTLLEKINSHGRMSISEIKRIFSQLISALFYLHFNLKVAHRDLKLENIMLDENNNVRLVDFGLSVTRNNENHFKTLCGSFPYTAPEIFKQSPYLCEVDIWSLGVCMYAAAVGALPFHEENTSKLIYTILHKEPNYPLHIPPALKDLLTKILTKNIEQRATLYNIIEHPFFMNSLVHMYTSNNISSLIPDLATIDPSIVNKMKKMGININRCHVDNSRESVFYKIERAEMIKKLILEKESHVHKNITYNRETAIVLPNVDDKIVKIMRKNFLKKSSNSRTTKSVKMQTSQNTQRSKMSHQKNIPLLPLCLKPNLNYSK